MLALNASEIEFFRRAMASEAKFSMPEFTRYVRACGRGGGGRDLSFFCVCFLCDLFGVFRQCLHVSHVLYSIVPCHVEMAPPSIILFTRLPLVPTSSCSSTHCPSLTF